MFTAVHWKAATKTTNKQTNKLNNKALTTVR